MRRLLAVSVLALALVASGCARGPTGPQRYVVDVDAPSPEGEKFQFSAYYPGSLRANGGDTIVFRNRSTEAPHTVTFGVLADRSNQPALFFEGGENPAAFGPCFTEEMPTPELNDCPEQEPPAFDGVGYWNSGLLMAEPVPDAAGPKDAEVELADDIAPGRYSFVCVLHPFMNGSLEIVRNERDRESPESVESEGQRAAEGALESAGDLQMPELEREDESVTVSAGWGDRVVSVNRFAPEEVEIEAGTMVNWVVRNPYEPHTVTFESTLEGPEDPGAPPPGGVPAGSDYTGGFAHSGFIGAEGGPFGEGFSLRFTEPGAYTYVCVIHPGQEGLITVT